MTGPPPCPPVRPSTTAPIRGTSTEAADETGRAPAGEIDASQQYRRTMSRTVNHTHDVPEGWPFDMPPNTAVLTTRRVVEGQPILQVFHDPDGEWQFLCGSTVTREDGRVACIACVVSREPSLAQLADIPIGWLAYRDSPEQPWARTRYEGAWEQ